MNRVASIAPSLEDLLAQAVADRLERNPTLLRIALGNIERRLARGSVSHPAGLERWRDLLQQAQRSSEALHRLLELLRKDTEEARRWRDFSPFAGVLSATESA